MQASGSQQQNIQAGMLAQISQDVRAATVGSMWFAAQWGLVLTYYNVTTQDQNNCQNLQNPPGNCMVSQTIF